jgi:hypothetical protein
VSELKEFFSASVGAAAALIGLLFVAVTFAPERITGADADMNKRGGALGAFFALANVFFVSLAALLPRHAEQVIIGVALISIFNVAGESEAMRRRYPGLRGWRRFGLTSLAIYLIELVLAVRLSLKIANPQSLGLIYTVLGLYSYALGTSWRLLGFRDAAPPTRDPEHSGPSAAPPNG